MYILWSSQVYICMVEDSSALLRYPSIFIQFMIIIAYMRSSPTIYIYIIQFICLFVHNSGQNYCTGCHQTLRDYGVRLGKCPPWVEIDHLTVYVERAFDFQFNFSFTADYRPSDFQLSGNSIGCHPTIDTIPRRYRVSMV